MKKSLFCLVLALFAFTAGNRATAQIDNKTKREIRKENRQAIDSLERAQLRKFLEQHDFEFNAKEIESTGRVGVTSIRLNQLWYVSVKPNMIKCFLPIYGAREASSQPQILRRMDFTTTNYDIQLVPGYRDSYNAVIKVTDPKSNTKYILEFEVSSTGRNVRLRISTNFDAPVTFMGDILK